MNLLILGCGIQGKAILFYLSRSDKVKKITCADYYPGTIRKFSNFLDMNKIMMVETDAADKKSLISIMKQDFDVVIDVLPPRFMASVVEAAIESGVSLVNTNYGFMFRHLHQQALEKNISIMPECGLDPGIDLVIYGHCVQEFDEINILNSYCGGIPEKIACDNPINYKISWSWEAMLKSQMRESILIKDGKKIVIPPADQHNNEMIHEIEFSELGQLEAFPNGNAVFYTDLLGITDTIRETGRYSLRWPGWCAFLHPLKVLNFLRDETLAGLAQSITPFQFMVKLLEPQLQYKEDEKDIIVMRNVFMGMKNGKNKKIESNLFVERDLKTGLLAMSLCVGSTASIVAQMIGSGEIDKKGILSPAIDIPYESFIKQLENDGIKINDKIEMQ